MENVNIQYKELLCKILDEGFEYTDKSRGVQRKQIASTTLNIDLQQGFPAINLKKLYWNGIVGELIWFLKGDTNIKYLVDNNIHIWDKDAYNYYLKQYPKTHLSYDDWLIEIGNIQTIGDLGRVYGAQWRKFTVHNVCPNDSFPIYVDQISNLIRGLKENPMGTRHLVTAWNPAELDDMALPPCFTEETLINTNNGYKKIININKNDLVLTKEGDYQKVYQKMITPYEGTLIGFNVKGRTDIIKCTPNHEFYVKDKGWIQSLFIEENDFVGTPINNKSEIPIHIWEIKKNQFVNINKSKKLDNKDLWWLMGYFIGDGWVSNNKNDINLAISDKEYDLVYNKIKNIVPSLNKGQLSGKSARYYFNSIEFATLFRKFGHKAKNKFIPEFVLNAPKEYLIEFIEGYKMADGTKKDDIYQFGTISESLAYGIQIILTKLNIPCSVNKTKKDKYKIIEGRKVKQNEFYYIVESYKKESLDVIIEKDIIWYRVKNKYLFKNIKTKVYNISVENSHTYTAYNIINHNCHWSFEILVEPLSQKKRVAYYDKINDHVFYAVNKRINLFDQYLNEANIPKYQFTLKWHQRSVDTFLGLPFNIASYALLAHIIGKLTNMVPKALIGDLSNVHLYENSWEASRELIKRDPTKFELPKLGIMDHLDSFVSDDINNFINALRIQDFKLLDYESYDNIKVAMLAPNK